MADYYKLIKLYPIIDADLLQLEKNYDVSLQKLMTGAIEMELTHDNKQFRMPAVKKSNTERDVQQKGVYLTMSDPRQIEYVRSITKGLQTLYIKAILRKHLSQYLEFIAFGRVTEDPSVTYVDMPCSGRKNNTRKKKLSVESEHKYNATNIQSDDDGPQTTFEKILEDKEPPKKAELHVTELKDYFDERTKAILKKGNFEDKSEKTPIKKENSVDKETEEPFVADITQATTEVEEPVADIKTHIDNTDTGKDETPNLMKWLDGVN